MEDKAIVLEDFLNEYGLYWKFKDYVEQRGFNVEDYGIEEEDPDY